jgi:aryl-alcohol dehydrogenase-like predicted oxidoreductase
MAQAFGITYLGWGLLEGGELTGKYNSASVEPKRSKDTSDRIKGMAATLMALAAEIGRTPSQVALNWARQGPYRILPILGARTQAQLKDNLGCLDFVLTLDQLSRLSAASPIDLGFPTSFLASDYVHGLIFGKTYDKLKK